MLRELIIGRPPLVWEGQGEVLSGSYKFNMRSER